VKNYFAYVRVSTVKQGEHGVSLQEQRDAISRYASKNSLAVADWFEERETAAKRGRPVFSEMLRLLKKTRANGVIIRKIDRSARNLRDWAELIELSEQFRFEVHFANEGVDLSSRGGRLSADIQAVVATDFIRNLREETRKGFYGRLKQGIYPLPAPVGYTDPGRGKAKVPDPVTAPLVRRAFELYASGSCNLKQLRERMAALGLRTRRGSPLSLNGLSVMLNNSFYIGLIRLKSTKEVFLGAHEPIITTALFEHVQSILNGKTNAKGWRHDFLFRRLLSCATCGRSLIGELQKGHIYYRCQTGGCPVTCIREEVIDGYAREMLSRLVFTAEERAYLADNLPRIREDAHKERAAHETALNLHLAQLKDRLVRLTDAYIDRLLEKDVFEERKAALLLEQKKLEEQRSEIDARGLSVEDQVAEYLELAGSAYFLYEMGFPEEKRDLLKILNSNRRVSGKNLDFTLFPPFQTIALHSSGLNGSPFINSKLVGR
jgi:DNA invertase Pin-like site-specific DNA recombinase